MALIQYISRIQFDFGALSLLGAEIARLGIARPLLVTDPGIAAAGLLERALDAAHPSMPVVYDRTPGNPTEAALEACLELWAEHGCDGVVALGGGSALDLAKAVALLTSHGGRFADYGVKSGGSERIGRVTPHIAVPTAAGTGAEIGRASVLILHGGRKCVAVNLNLVANAVICDPELTLSLPSGMTAATGIDALSHGIEALCSTSVNPPADAIARDCIARAARWLPVALAEPRNRDARYEMMMAALEGGMVLQKGLGAAHAMANPLGEGGWHHGTLIGALLPHAMTFNAPVVPRKMDEIRQALGGTASAPDQVAALVEAIGLPGSLAEIGVSRSSLAGIARDAARDHLSATNPRPASEADYLDLLTRAF